MSGHSKWKNIKIRKEKQDAKRGTLFTRLARDIILAVREGGSDPESNYSLKMAIQKAKEANMPGDNIRRTIDKAVGGAGGAKIEHVVYEAYAPHGVALLLDVATDNRNRAAGEIRAVFSKYGGSLGEAGCVAWMFEKLGLVLIDKAGVEEEVLMEAALSAGAGDLSLDEDQYQITCAPADLHAVSTALEKGGFKLLSSSITMVPKNTVILGRDQAGAVLRLVECLEDLDDIQQVHANFDIPAEILEELTVE